MQANKNGFYYVLDHTTGEFISGTPFVGGISWATGLDSSGRPIEVPLPGSRPFVTSPNPGGAHNWDPMAFSPNTGLVYLSAKAGSQTIHAPDTAWKFNPDQGNVGYDEHYDGSLNAKYAALPKPNGELLAWDPVGKRAARRVRTATVNGSGVLATAGSLVFQGDANGTLGAYNAADGAKLWSFDAGTGIMAPPVTYMVGGVQYVAVMVGWGGPDGLYNDTTVSTYKSGYGRLMAFALGAKASFTPTSYGHTQPPTPSLVVAKSGQVKEGERLFGNQCVFCHGANAIAGPTPDLRYMSPEVHASFDSIVTDGARSALGMPSFRKLFTPRQVKDIHAYIMWRATESAMAAKHVGPPRR